MGIGSMHLQALLGCIAKYDLQPVNGIYTADDFTFKKLLLQPLEYPPVEGLEGNEVDNSVPSYLMAFIRIDRAGR